MLFVRSSFPGKLFVNKNDVCNSRAFRGLFGGPFDVAAYCLSLSLSHLSLSMNYIILSFYFFIFLLFSLKSGLIIIFVFSGVICCFVESLGNDAKIQTVDHRRQLCLLYSRFICTSV